MEDSYTPCFTGIQITAGESPKASEGGTLNSVRLVLDKLHEAFVGTSASVMR